MPTSSAKTQWQQPPDPGRGPWDYAQFSNEAPAPEPDHTFEMLIQKIPGNKKDFNHWTINGKSFPDIEKLRVQKGKRYRLSFNNDSGDVHPLHLHRHLFEITQVGDKRMSGLRKDVISVARRSKASIDFVANNPGIDALSLPHAASYGFRIHAVARIRELNVFPGFF